MIHLGLPDARVTLTDADVLRLRKLRLHHWRCAQRSRDLEERGGEAARLHHAAALLHVECVEALRPLFPDPADTAARDDRQQRWR